MGRKNRTGKGRARAAMQTPAAREQAARLYNRGVQLEQADEPAQAEGAYRQALALDPGLAQAHNNLGNMLQARGKWKPAEKCYRQALALVPENALLLSNIGNALQHQGRLAEALDVLRQAVAIDPKHAQAHNNLANTLAALERDDEALEAFREANRLAPGDAEIACNLGEALNRRELYEESFPLLRKAAAGNAQVPDLHVVLGDALRGLKEWDSAVAAYRRALALHANATAYGGLAAAQLGAGRPLDARRAAEQAIAMEPAESRHHARLGGVLRSLHLLDTAEQVLRKALAMPPGPAARSHARHHLELGLVLKKDGRRHREAGEAYRKALELDPGNTVAFKLLAAQAKHTGLAVDRGAAEQRLRDAALSVRERGNLHFGLAYACEALADHARALHHLREANRLRASVRPYDPAEYADLVEKLTPAFDAELLARPAPPGPGDKPPIFVVGLPRAGKTLLASALGRHSQVDSADESPEFANAVDRVFGARGGPAYPGDVAEVDATLLARVGSEFTEHESRKFDHPGRIASTDPQLDCYLGMLHLCLPGAKIIHVSRGLRDNCVEIYRKDFETEYHGYSYDLAATVERYRLHHGLMAHWKALLPGAIHTLAFEDLVRDPEAALREVAAFCDLPWEDACGAGPWPTLANAVGTWRRYAAELGPLFDELGAE